MLPIDSLKPPYNLYNNILPFASVNTVILASQFTVYGKHNLMCIYFFFRWLVGSRVVIMERTTAAKTAAAATEAQMRH